MEGREGERSLLVLREAVLACSSKKREGKTDIFSLGYISVHFHELGAALSDT